MARVALKLPKVGLVMENARLVRWLKTAGQVVQQGEPLLELETEKSVVEIESTATGRLVEVLVHADQELHVGDQIAWLESDVSDAVASAPHSAAVPHPSTALAPPSTAAPSALPAAVPGLGNRADDRRVPRPTAAGAGGRIRSSPAARRLANQHGLDLRRIPGTGPRGRVQLADVRGATGDSASRDAATPLASGRQPLSAMRRALARSMSLSNATIPQFAVERAVDWTRLRTIRGTLLAELPPDAPRPSVNDFLLQAVARTLLAFPNLNATFSGDADAPDAAIVQARGAHIGMAVAVGDGLLVPVLHDVEQFGIAELARRRTDVVQRAMNGKLKREELEGATCSLSNLGSNGPDRFNAIINPPQSAILAVGRERDVVVPVDAGIQVRPVSQLTLTVDHRVADGRLASDFLAALVGILEGDVWRLS